MVVAPPLVPYGQPAPNLTPYAPMVQPKAGPSKPEYPLAAAEFFAAAGVTIAVITHDKDIAARMPRRVELLDGCVVADSGQAPGAGRLLPVGGQR